MGDNAIGLASRLPHADERAMANTLRRVLAANTRLRLPDELGEMVLSPALTELLLELLRHIGNGDAVTIIPVSQMLTTQEAADLLNVSRPFLITLLERGDLYHFKVGRHRRIKAEDLFDYRRRRDQRRDEAMMELSEIDGDLI